MNHDGARIRKLRAIKLCIIAIGHFKNDALDILVKPEFGELAHPIDKRQCILNAADLGLEQLYYLNLGEPFLSPNIGPELALLRQKNG